MITDYDLPVEEAVCNAETRKHILKVAEKLLIVIQCLQTRARRHDASKLGDEERPLFAASTQKLRGLTYGSEEYTAALKLLGPALTHHYSVNRHHPEHFPEGVDGMNLVDIVELLCDFAAAVERHEDGDLMKSIEINKERFGFSDQLTQIFRNTAWLLMPGMPVPPE